MTEDVLQQLFEIGFDAPATRALCVRYKELPVITDSAAQACHLPEVGGITTWLCILVLQVVAVELT